MTVILQHCSPDLESFFINCKPFYLPRDFVSLILVFCTYGGVLSLKRPNICSPTRFWVWQLKKFNLPRTMMVHFYTAIIESIHLLHHHLVHCCHCQGQEQTAAYHPHCWEGDRLQSAYPRKPAHLEDPEASEEDCGWFLRPWTLFQPLPIRTKTSRHKKSLFPSATRLNNKAPNWHWYCHFASYSLALKHIFSI